MNQAPPIECRPHFESAHRATPTADGTASAVDIHRPESDRNSNSSILFVDDEQCVLDGFRRMLRPFTQTWNAHFLSDSRKAIDTVRRHHIDVVVVDLLMPFITGIELVEQMQADDEFRHVPVIVVTGQNDRDLKRCALDAGATDLLNKPVVLEELLARIRSSVRLKACYDELHSRNSELERRVEERTQQLRRSRLEIIARLGRAAEYRDKETGRHVMRVAHYSRLIAIELNLPEDEIDAIFAAAPLHDVGKIAIPDSILLKPGLLTYDERRIMQTHCAVGEKILNEGVYRMVDKRLACENDWIRSYVSTGDIVLATARQIAATHHEHWDGGGYPEGLAGEQIPIAGRIVALADVFDALTTKRTYKAAYPPEQALRIIADGVGKQFDPIVHEAFLAAMPQIEIMRLQLHDDLPSLFDDLPEADASHD